MELNVDAISNYLQRLINGIPMQYQVMETVLGNIGYFCINGLAIIGKLDEVLSPERKKEIIDWVYTNQVQPPLLGGFRHSPAHFTPNHTVEETHIVMTFSYLAMLILLGDDLSRVDTKRVMESLHRLQLPNGSFLSHTLGSEDDLRFVFSAAATCKMLGTNDGVDVEKAIEFILSCQTYEGGFAYRPGDESHGGATYCAVAALDLWGALDRIKDKRLLAYWLSQRQEDGFNGRAHKLTDTCYSFWIGSPLSVLGWFDDIVDKRRLTSFIFSNYCDNGQFRPNSHDDPDIVHTFFSLSGLSLAGYPGTEPIHPSLGIVRKYIPERILNPQI
ncbi:Prenyltransferase and squalene oxidase repeat family protein [Tritrichomonas foetus]|uniref:Prenyltransferase and squalene oxidase repeat family protein n=1 Tax=Tritrichomonas foetus TaxID=1144522 RepID=A0A1J4JAG1_9EUKA|nr:Prenyltransferase and squalene oxidase repeat family protein [Tritrichomonas foetus]|eukprot:OHS94252.1 Prenyltransferase and squalene oxidase repeat family protein [Tritrichomonas foetus]